jgi:hypothetical protein
MRDNAEESGENHSLYQALFHSQIITSGTIGISQNRTYLKNRLISRIADVERRPRLSSSIFLVAVLMVATLLSTVQSFSPFSQQDLSEVPKLSTPPPATTPTQHRQPIFQQTVFFPQDFKVGTPTTQSP